MLTYMKQYHRSMRPGFTIPELLIVIVVIGIIGMIVLLTYKGVATRGYNAQITQGVQQYDKAIRTYRGLNGAYPKVTGEDGVTTGVFMTCLGTGYPSAQCGVVSGATIVEDGVFNTAISGVIGTRIPLIGKNVITGSGETFIGAVYGIDIVDPSKNPDNTTSGRVINYALMGTNTDCSIAGAYQYASSTSPATTLCEIYYEKYPK
jgi:prepilin-type N-terminal cleavage/methylation domain-containing protein